MNGFRLTGDSLHVLAIVILFWKFVFQRSSAGISGITQILYFLTYTLRYMDFWYYGTFVSSYNSAMKMFFICTAFASVINIYGIQRSTYQSAYDRFRSEIVIIPVTILAFIVNHELSLEEVCWTWSIYMEAVALLPQFYMIWKGSKIDWSMLAYLIAMGGYRGMYIFNWIYRYYFESYYDSIAIVAGVVETTIVLAGLSILILRNISKYSNWSGVQIPSVFTIPSAVEEFQNNFKKSKYSDGKSDTKVLIQDSANTSK